jgi:hypothetical protein
MNKHAKQSINVKALDPKTETAAKKDPGASPEMSIAGAIDTLADIAKRSTNLFRIYTEQLRSDDGYQVIHVSRFFPEGRCRPGIINQAAMRTLGRFGAALAGNGNPHAVKYAGRAGH